MTTTHLLGLEEDYSDVQIMTQIIQAEYHDKDEVNMMIHGHKVTFRLPNVVPVA
jgi:hypothetical protein